MTLKMFFDIKEAKKVDMRLTVVMPLEDWDKVRVALKSAAESEHWHPANEMVRIIDDMVRKANETFWDQSSEAHP